ncbi:MAG: cache domain-containing protein, partial [Desulfobacteraceae bacterium]|nr:cache domain-containing protein [Desulfobacteraceae bacterium]
MKNRSLKFKLILSGVLVVIIPLTVVGLFSLNKASDALVISANNQAAQIAQDLAMMTDSVLNQEVKLVREMGVNPLITNAVNKVSADGIDDAGTELKAVDQFLKTVSDNIGEDYDVFFVTNAQGAVISDNSDGSLREKGITVSDREYFIEARNTGKVGVGQAVASRSTGAPILGIAVPIKTASGAFGGVFGVAVKLDELSRKIASVKIGSTGYPFMIDKTGLIVAHPRSEFILDLNIGNLEGMESICDSMTAQKTGVENYTFEVDKIAGYAPIPLTEWSIGVTQDVAEFMAPVRAIRNVVLIAGGIFLVLTILLVIWFARSITLPINRIILGLNEGSDQVAEASSQVSVTSQSLAEGASEQAASIEESSSSMEEMAAM